MKYKVTLYRKGKAMQRIEVEAKSHKKAIDNVLSLMKWEHAKIVGKTTKRYTRKFTLIKDTPKVFKTTVDQRWTILIMFGKYSEFVYYPYKESRDKDYKSLCQYIDSMSAESAKADPAPINTTASSEETGASKNGSTSPKTSNGSVANVTNWDLPTPLSIVEHFGKSKSEGMESDGWNSGWTPSPSKPKQTLWATVKIIGNPEMYPVATPSMLAMQDKKIEVEKVELGAVPLYKGAGYYWHPDWLELDVEPKKPKISINYAAMPLSAKTYTTDES